MITHKQDSVVAFYLDAVYYSLVSDVLSDSNEKNVLNDDKIYHLMSIPHPYLSDKADI